MKRLFLAGPVLAAALCVLSPGTGGAVPDPAGKPAWGTVSGRITWGGKDVPKRLPIQVNSDRGHCLANGAIVSEDYVIDPASKGIRWTFVWLIPTGKQPLAVHPDLRKPPGGDAAIDLVSCRFAPHVLALRQGQDVEVRNLGAIAFNVCWQGGPRNKGGSVLLPARRNLTIKGLKEDRMPIQLVDNIHRWMKAWVRVFDHPYYAVTDANGKFTIPKVPAGRCRLVVWHESVGWGPGGKAGVAVTVRGGRGAVVNLTLKSTR